jgi:DNA mismatch endonuclease (patch repair protein)
MAFLPDNKNFSGVELRMRMRMKMKMKILRTIRGSKTGEWWEAGMDIKSVEARSRNMAKIKSTRTAPEMFVRSRFYKRGLRYRANCAGIPGKPDLYFPGRRVAVFVQGCYWHRHPGCKYAYTPASRPEFWLPKLEGNRIRDLRVREELKGRGIRVLIVWECTVRRMMRNDEFCGAVLEQAIRFVREGMEDFLEL